MMTKFAKCRFKKTHKYPLMVNKNCSICLLFDIILQNCYHNYQRFHWIPIGTIGKYAKTIQAQLVQLVPLSSNCTNGLVGLTGKTMNAPTAL